VLVPHLHSNRFESERNALAQAETGKRERQGGLGEIGCAFSVLHIYTYRQSANVQ